MGETLAYHTSAGVLPRAPTGRLVKVQFDTCPGTTLSVHLLGALSDGVDAHGMSDNSWWAVRCDSLPDRTLRLYRGAHSMAELLRRYGFQDSSGCVNHKRCRLTYEPDGATWRTPGPAWIQTHLRDVTGVPQFHRNSGVCWFATFCGTSFLCDDVRKLLEPYLPDDDLRTACRRCNFDRGAAEHVRRRLWYELGVGDNVDNPPEMDGRNGFAEFCLMCAHYKVPLLRYRERGGALSRMDPRVTDQSGKVHRLTETTERPHLVALRFQDGDHTRKFPVLRRIRIGSQRYKLTGMYMGQKKCGHQIGLTSPSGKWRDWVVVDADMHKDGIGPTFVTFDGREWVDGWWNAWRDLVHVTKYGMNAGEFCNLSPWNPRNDALDKYRGPRDFGTNSLDVLYVPCSDRATSPRSTASSARNTFRGPRKNISLRRR